MVNFWLVPPQTLYPISTVYEKIKINSVILIFDLNFAIIGTDLDFNAPISCYLIPSYHFLPLICLEPNLLKRLQIILFEYPIALKPVFHIQRSAKKNVNFAKQDPGRVRQSS